MSIIIAPTINHNGSSATDLLDGLERAVVAAQDLRNALRAITPHGRDYPGREEACSIARDVHFERITSITALESDLLQIAAAIISQRG